MTVRRVGLDARVLAAALAVVLLQACTSSAPAVGPDLTVTKTTDSFDGACQPRDCSLREAIAAANASPGANTIHLAPGTYVLTLHGADEDADATGDLDVTDDLTIIGSGFEGSEGTFLRAGPDNGDRILHVLGGETVIEGAYLGGGEAAAGGAVYVAADASLTLRNVRLDASRATGSGGGGLLYNEGTLTVESSRFTNGCSAGPGGALTNAGRAELTDAAVESSEAVGSGGAIANPGTLTATNLEITRTYAGSGVLCGVEAASDGGGIYSEGDLTLADSQILRTEASRDGGAIASLGALQVDRTTMRAVAGGDGGAVAVLDGRATLSALDLNATATGDGGAGYVAESGTATIDGSALTGAAVGNGGGLANAGDLTLQGSTITSSRAAVEGGGLFSSGTLHLEASSVRINSAGGRGGGIFTMGTSTIEASTISGNTADQGGGMFLEGDVAARNCTVSANNASTSGGGVVVSGTGDIQITHCTLTRNVATVASGLLAESYATISNTIIGGNTGGPNCEIQRAPVAIGDLDEDGSCQFPPESNLTGLAPLLASLQNNGGLTETHLLAAGSPARDAAAAAKCLPADQRGVSRPQGGACDIGAVEMEPGS